MTTVIEKGDTSNTYDGGPNAQKIGETEEVQVSVQYASVYGWSTNRCGMGSRC